MPVIRLADILTATGGRLVGPTRVKTFTDFSYDSRIVEPGQLFVAVVTETGNGHDFVMDACRAGAAGVLCQYPPAEPLPATCIVVDDTQQALLAYAAYILRARALPVIGMTGSVGKTSTKEAVASVLGERYAIFRNHGSYNGRFGLPISLGRLDDKACMAVLEMACDGLGEIRVLAEATQPVIGVVTQISHSHTQYLGTPDDIAREKGCLIAALPSHGTAVLNADDPRVRAMAARTSARVITYGLELGADLVGRGIEVSPQGTRLEVCWRGETIPLAIPLIGAHHAYTALAAAAVGLACDLSWDEIARGLAKVAPMPGRTRLLDGINGSRILDDSYNASPASSLAALEALCALPARRRLVLLGDMAELGSYAQEGHRRVGQRCAAVADYLVTKGDLAQLAAEAALQAGIPPERVRVTHTASDAARALAALAEPEDLILIKGSAEARLEFITRELLRRPQEAPTVLPRQTRGWRHVRLGRPGRPAWVDVDLEAVAGNVRAIVERVGPDVEVLAVLKADAYGHGAARVAHTALNNGATWLGVACLGEAIALRRAGIAAPILTLGYTPPWQAREAVATRDAGADVATTLFSLEVAHALSRAAVDLGRTARVHIKVDTGMGRLGLLPDDVLPFVRAVAQLPGLVVDGIFTHMAAADDADPSYTLWQLECFKAVLAALDREGLRPPRVHAANSAAILRFPQSHYSMVRLGLAMYGLNPSLHVALPAGFRPALRFACQIAQVKELPPGSAISYGCTFRTTRPSRIAVIPVGYADGFRRAPAHWGHVLVHGQRAPIVGRVCMDQTMIDVTDIPGVRPGDEVVLIGSQGADAITVDEVAEHLGTINYEVISEILARVPRMV